MNPELLEELARRLDVSRDDVEPALDTVVERIRQQVAHYGYARLADLGTFRQQDDELVFEADPALAESVNARFAGLEAIVLERGDPTSAPAPSLADEDAQEDRDMLDAGDTQDGRDAQEDEGIRDDQDDEAPSWAGVAEPDEEDVAPGEGFGPPEQDETVSDGVGPPEEDGSLAGGIGPPDAESDYSWDEPAGEGPSADESVDVGTSEPEDDLDLAGVSESADSSAEEEEKEDQAWDDHAGETHDADDVDDGVFWNDAGAGEEEHPLGPESEPPYEEAEFDVVGDPETTSASESDRDPTISWSPLGADKSEETVADASVSADEDAETPPDADQSQPAVVDYEPGAVDDETDAVEDDDDVPDDQESDAETVAGPRAPDREAESHGLHGDRSVRTVRPPSRRSRNRRDPKPIWFGVGIIVIVAAAAVAYFTLPDTPPAPEQAATMESTAPEQADTAEAESLATAAAEPPTEAGDPSAADAVPAPPDPLRGDEPLDPDAGGLTIVVLSTTDSVTAGEAAQQYGAQGLRASVVPEQQDGVTRYRVAIGQFDTLEDANAQREALAGSELPADAWILRF